ncbi:hypothetical protein BKA66DRAFT_604332 [Pyrenochaeta sp. MPI-SDFR-AT-0127]|nr:hypothetical protein BKA66DRAFT_604332 [Pyrenochaeta sp. MPI-SDFR-AT-0127]
MNCIRSAIPYLNPGSCIVNISSILRHHGLSKGADSAASKAGVIALTRCIAHELAPQNIRINAIAPGPVDTLLMAGSLADFRCVLGASWEDIVPMGHLGAPEEVADLTEFL